MGRRSSQAAFSLFAFQDIITSVTGIMVLVTLILAIELVERVQSAPVNETAEQAAQTRETIQELKREIDSLESLSSETSDIDLSDLPSLDAETLANLTEELQASSERLERELAKARSRSVEKTHEVKAAKSRTDSIRQQSEKKQSELERDIARTKEQLDEISRGDRIYYKPDKSNKTMWLVEIEAHRIAVARVGVREPPQSFDSITQFDLWLEKLSVEQNAFLLLVKPGGENQHEKCSDLLDDSESGSGFQYGVQLLGQDQIVIDPQTGAGGP